MGVIHLAKAAPIKNSWYAKIDQQKKVLVDSMKGIGQIQDVIVRPLFQKKEENFKYGLVAGSRRFNAIVFG